MQKNSLITPQIDSKRIQNLKAITAQIFSSMFISSSDRFVIVDIPIILLHIVYFMRSNATEGKSILRDGTLCEDQRDRHQVLYVLSSRTLSSSTVPNYV